MTRKCAVCGMVQVNENVSFYGLPSKAKIKKAWINFIKLKRGSIWKPNKNVFICNQHFDISSYRISILANSQSDRVYLKPHAIPSILEPEHNNTSSNINTKSTQSNKEQPMCNNKERNKISKKLLVEKTGSSHDTSTNREVFLQTQSNFSEINERNTLTKDSQLESTVSNDIQLECINNKDQSRARPKNLHENLTSENELEKQLDKTIQDISIKKKSKQGRSAKRAPRIGNASFLGDIKLNDFTNLEHAKEYWDIALETIQDLRKENKELRRKCLRYKTTITDLKSLVTHLEKEKFQI